MIKTIRRKAYGYRDTEYFFLKIKFASMRGPYKFGSIQKSVGIHNKTKQIGDDEIKGSIL